MSVGSGRPRSRRCPSSTTRSTLLPPARRPHCRFVPPSTCYNNCLCEGGQAAAELPRGRRQRGRPGRTGASLFGQSSCPCCTDDHPYARYRSSRHRTADLATSLSLSFSSLFFCPPLFQFGHRLPPTTPSNERAHGKHSWILSYLSYHSILHLPSST